MILSIDTYLEPFKQVIITEMLKTESLPVLFLACTFFCALLVKYGADANGIEIVLCGIFGGGLLFINLIALLLKFQ